MPTFTVHKNVVALCRTGGRRTERHQSSAERLQATARPSSRQQRRRPDIPTIRRLPVDPDKVEAVCRACKELRVPVRDGDGVTAAAESGCGQSAASKGTAAADDDADDDNDGDDPNG